MALSSALLFVVLLFEDVSDLVGAASTDLPWGLVLRYVLAMALAGAAMGAVLSGLFGRHGVVGWALAVVAGIVVATLSGMLGSLFGGLPDLLERGWRRADLIPLIAGAMVLPWAVAGWTWLLGIWLALVAFAHVRARRIREHLAG